jgi:hypothetical protein
MKIAMRSLHRLPLLDPCEKSVCCESVSCNALPAAIIGRQNKTFTPELAGMVDMIVRMPIAIARILDLKDLKSEILTSPEDFS